MSEPKFIYVTYIVTTPERLWQALTDGAFTERYWFGTRVESDWTPGAPVSFRRAGALSDSGHVLKCEPFRLLSYPSTSSSASSSAANGRRALPSNSSLWAAR